MLNKTAYASFDSKVKELTRNIALVSSHIETVHNTMSLIITFSQDIEMLSLELNLTPGERESLKTMTADIFNTMQSITNDLQQALQSSKNLSSRMNSSYMPYLDKEVSNPFMPLYKVANTSNSYTELLKLGQQYPQLRKHIQPIMEHLKSKELK